MIAAQTAEHLSVVINSVGLVLYFKKEYVECARSKSVIMVCVAPAGSAAL